VLAPLCWGIGAGGGRPLQPRGPDIGIDADLKLGHKVRHEAPEKNYMVPQFFVPRNYGTQTENWEQGTRKLGAPTTLRAQSGNTETENNMNIKQRYRLTRLAHHKQSHKYVVRSQIFAPPPKGPSRVSLSMM